MLKIEDNFWSRLELLDWDKKYLQILEYPVLSYRSKIIYEIFLADKKKKLKVIFDPDKNYLDSNKKYLGINQFQIIVFFP